MHNKMVHMVTFILLIAGGLNWLLVGLFDYDLVMNIAGMVGMPALAQVVYVAVGASAVYELIIHKGSCRMCGSGGM
jgi:uncharacterized protein